MSDHCVWLWRDWPTFVWKYNIGANAQCVSAHYLSIRCWLAWRDFVCLYRTFIGRRSRTCEFWLNWIWVTTTWPISSLKLFRATKGCKLWRCRTTKSLPLHPTSSHCSNTWKRSTCHTTLSTRYIETLLKTWAIPSRHSTWTTTD